MSVTLEFAEGLQVQLERKFGDLARAAKEALAVEGYRSGKLSSIQVGNLLDMDSGDALAWLRDRGEPLSYDVEEYRQDVANLSELFPEIK